MNSKKTILVHSCCASCSSYVLDHLRRDFEVVAFYYNPNIQPEEEYLLRLSEMKRLCGEFGVKMVTGPYRPQEWERAIAKYRHLPEKSPRCRECYRFRIEKTAAVASRMGIGLFTTTLSVSPHKIFEWIALAGAEAGGKYKVEFHPEDFKKRDGFKISVRKSRELGLTRQNYCGCPLSLEESRRRMREKKENPEI